jgi:hypothetical protein
MFSVNLSTRECDGHVVVACGVAALARGRAHARHAGGDAHTRHAGGDLLLAAPRQRAARSNRSGPFPGCGDDG